MFYNYDDYLKNIPTASGSQPNLAADEAAEKPKKEITNIFAGITKADIEAIGDKTLKNKLLDEFRNADDDGDNTISQSEYDRYVQLGFFRHKFDMMTKKDLEEIIKDEKVIEAALKAFDEADIDGDGMVSNDEINNYIQKNRAFLNNVANDAIGKSGKRSLQDGKYIVKEGDTILNIASDFGISPMELINTNKDNISNVSNLQIGLELDISKCKIDNENKIKEDTEIVKLMMSDDKKDKVRAFMKINKPSGATQIFTGMTRAQAEEAGGKTLEAFNQYCGGGDVVTQENFANYQKALYHNIKKEDLGLFVKDIVGDKLEAKDIKTIIDIVLPTLLETNSRINSDNASDISTKIYEKMKTSVESLDRYNAVQRSTDFYHDIEEMINEDISSDNGAYKFHKDRLAKGEFSDFERNILGLNPDIKLTEEQIEQYAELATKAEYIKPVLGSISDAVENANDEEIMLFIGNISKKFVNNSSMQKLFEAYGLTGLSDNSNKRFMANTFAERDDDSFTEADALSQGVYTAVLARNADADAFETFIINNSADLEFIKDVASAVIDNMPDGEKKTALQNAVDKAYETITSNSAGESGGAKGASSSGTGSPGRSGNVSGYNSSENSTVNQNSSAYVSTPTNISAVEAVIKYKEAANGLYVDFKKINTLDAEMLKVEEMAERMRKMEIKIQELKNKTLGAALSEIFAHFDEMPADIKIRFQSHLKAMDDNHICLAYITGNDEFRQYLTGLDLVNNEKLFRHFDANPVDIKKAPDRIISEYYKTRSEEYNNNKNNENIDKSKQKDNWHIYQT